MQFQAISQILQVDAPYSMCLCIPTPSKNPPCRLPPIQSVRMAREAIYQGSSIVLSPAPPCQISLPSSCDYRIALKKLSSLIALLLFTLIALVKSSLAFPATMAPSTLPSPAGRSMLCSYSGIFGARLPGSNSACLRSFFAAMRRCFLDFAVRKSDQSCPICGKVYR